MNAKKIISIMLVIVWMSIVFCFSNQRGEGSSNTSRKVSELVVDIINIHYKYTDSEKEILIEKIGPYIRKLAHFTIYTIGGSAIANCIYQFYNKEKMQIGISASIGVLYAASDEVHQLMVAGRSGNIKDVIIDSLGIMTGIIFFLLMKEIIAKVVNKKNTIRGGE